MLPMSARAVPATAALLLILSGPAAAQDRQVFVYGGDRPRIGVMLEGKANPEHDKYGAFIEEVTPDGPAAKAGLQAADIITTFNGVSLAGLKSDDDQSGPSKKLRELASKLEVGDTVRVDYRRGSETRKATLVAAEVPMMSVRRMRSAGPDGDQMVWAPRGRVHMTPFPPGEGFRFSMDGGLWGLELATINAGLGEYFGAKSGALVLDVPSDSAVQLKAGDVIVAIDGRVVASEEQARRILRSYSDGETAKIEVMRQKKKATVTWKAPAADRMEGRVKMRVREGGPEAMKFEVEKD